MYRLINTIQSCILYMIHLLYHWFVIFKHHHWGNVAFDQNKTNVDRFGSTNLGSVSDLLVSKHSLRHPIWLTRDILINHDSFCKLFCVTTTLQGLQRYHTQKLKGPFSLFVLQYVPITFCLSAMCSMAHFKLDFSCVSKYPRTNKWFWDMWQFAMQNSSRWWLWW